jgi:hypothetical protein
MLKMLHNYKSEDGRKILELNKRANAHSKILMIIIEKSNVRTQLSWSLCLSSRMDCSLGPSLVSNACTARLVFSNWSSLMITLANCRYLARVCSRLGTGSLGSSAPCVM